MDLSVKRRPRRDVRRHDPTIRTSLSHVLESKAVTKNPTRFIPDALGFSELTKNEVKRDTKDIERKSFFSSITDTDSEDELEKAVDRSHKPLCFSETNVIKKRKRLVSWATNPHAKNFEIKELQENVDILKKDITQLDINEQRWLQSFERSRHILGQAFLKCRDENAKLRDDYKMLYEAFIKDFATTTRTRRGVHIKDILDELDETKLLQELKLKEYEKVCYDASSTKQAKCSIPILSMSVDELDYSWDHGPKTSTLPKSDEKSSLGYNQAPTDDQISVPKMFAAIEESVKLSELSLTDIEPYFLNDDQVESLYPDIDNLSGNVTTDRTINGKRMKRNSPIPWSRHLDVIREKQLCEPILAVKDEAAWVDLIDETSKQHNALAKRKRRGTGTVSLSSFATTRTPRGVRLLVSPWSQYEDRFLGVIHGDDNIADASSINIPDHIINEEDQLLERCHLQSLASASDTKIRRLRIAGNDWKKISQENKDVYNKMKVIHSNAVTDDYNESVRMRRELIAFGIASTNSLPIEVLNEVSTNKSQVILNTPVLTLNDTKTTIRTTNGVKTGKKSRSTPRTNGNGVSALSNLATAISSLIGFSQS